MLLLSRTLLVADSSPVIRKIAELVFRDEGMTVLCAANAKDALRFVEAKAFDILLLDAKLPPQGGAESCRRCKNLHPDVPVILLVGAFDNFTEAEAHRTGADLILTKPFKSIRSLVNRVGDLLSRTPTEQASPATTSALAPEQDKPLAPTLPVRASTAFVEMASPADFETQNFVASATTDEAMSNDTASVNAIPAFDSNGEDVLHQPASELLIEDENDNVENPISRYGIVTAQEVSSHAADDAHRLQPTLAPHAVTSQTITPQTIAPQDFLSLTDTTAPAEMNNLFEANASATVFADTDDAPLDLGDNNFQIPAHAAGNDVFEDNIFELDDLIVSSATRETVFNETPLHESATPNDNKLFDNDSHAALSNQETGAPHEASVHETSFDDVLIFGDEFSPDLPVAVEQEAAPPHIEFAPATIEINDDAVSSPLAAETAAEQSVKDDSPSTANAVRIETNAPHANGNEFPPEMIARIAELVVAQLSEKKIEEIAWEVVPAIAERIVKQQLETKYKS